MIRRILWRLGILDFVCPFIKDERRNLTLDIAVKSLYSQYKPYPLSIPMAGSVPKGRGESLYM